MGKDWDEPRDKAPPIEEVERHRKKGGRKSFIIEHRYIGPTTGIFSKLFASSRKWSIYRRYKNDRARNQAFHALTNRQEKSHLYYSKWEYRIPEQQ